MTTRRLFVVAPLENSATSSCLSSKISNADSGYQSKSSSTSGMPREGNLVSTKSASATSLAGYQRANGFTPSGASRSSLPSAAASLTSSAPDLEKHSLDYKKLYLEEKCKNERLERQLHETELLVERLKNKQNSLKSAAQGSSALSHPTSFLDKERMTMERRISELELALKQTDEVKAENQRIKEENGALIRVISKLSK